MYEILHCRPPFVNVKVREVVRMVKERRVEFDARVPKKVIELFYSILVVDPQKRPSIRKIL